MEVPKEKEVGVDFEHEAPEGGRWGHLKGGWWRLKGKLSPLKRFNLHLRPQLVGELEGLR